MSCLAKEEIIVLQCKFKKEKIYVCNVIWWEMGWGWGIPPNVISNQVLYINYVVTQL